MTRKGCCEKGGFFTMKCVLEEHHHLIWRRGWGEGRKEMFYLTTHSTHFIYGYMASDIWLRTILIVRKETCRHIGYSFRVTACVLLNAPSQTGLHIPRPLLHHSTQWVHTMKDRSDDPSHHERTLLPRSYILLLKKEGFSL